VGNYAGVTVERKEGRLLGTSRENPIIVLDLPGTYSLSPHSLDEQIARDILFHRLGEVPPPDLVVVVIDGSNLQRNLYFATQVIELGYPTVIALNMIDVAEQNGYQIDAKRLGSELGVPVYPSSPAPVAEWIACGRDSQGGCRFKAQPSRFKVWMANPQCFANCRRNSRRTSRAGFAVGRAFSGVTLPGHGRGTACPR